MEVVNTIVHQTTDSCVANDAGNASSLLQLRYSNLSECGVATSVNSDIEDTCTSEDPLFLDPQSDDYSLMPESPCVDAGDPESEFAFEPEPNGCRVNMGGFGNTAEAASAEDAPHCIDE